MNRSDLKKVLEKIGIDPRFYSLDGTLLPDRIVLYISSSSWIVFYFDERGNRNNELEFNSESKACEHILDLFKRSIQIKKNAPKIKIDDLEK